MSVFGLTGGIGAGKSTVAGMFQDSGIPVVLADDVGRQVVSMGSEGLSAIVSSFVRMERRSVWSEIPLGHSTKARPLTFREYVDRSYIGRILRLTLLAPDVIDAIVAGKEPSGLS